MTGRGMGYCGTGQAAGPAYGYGRGFGRGRGMGRGFGRGFGRGRGFGPRAAYPPAPADAETELNALKSQADQLRTELDAIHARMEALQNTGSEAG